MVRKKANLFLGLVFAAVFLWWVSTSIHHRTFEGVDEVEKKNVFFLKTHKCGSSTVQNILMRIAMELGLDVALPAAANYIGNPQPFSAQLVPRNLTPPDGRFDMLCHHTRLDVGGVRAAMRAGAAWVTVLREPTSLFESLYSYYGLNRSWGLSLQDLILKPNTTKISKRMLGRIGINQMAWDLGMPPQHFKSKQKMRKMLELVEREFDLVMVAEHMEASLVLLADLMRWPLWRVSSLKLNSRSKRMELNDAARKTLMTLNSADQQLYTHFLGVFRKKVVEYGAAKMAAQVSRLIALDARLRTSCVAATNTGGWAHTLSYKLKSSADVSCEYVVKHELSFTEELRQIQIQRISTLQKLSELTAA